jgi:uncharacterized protein YneF (UPF0154 family)
MNNLFRNKKLLAASITLLLLIVIAFGYFLTHRKKHKPIQLSVPISSRIRLV